MPRSPILDHAHQAGVIHRDLKPSNVLIDQEDRAHLTDFGLAKSESGQATLTKKGQIIGTPAYMAPEQAAGNERVDRRADVYCLGVIFYELLTGVARFTGASRCFWPVSATRTRGRRGGSISRSRPTWKPSASRRWPSSPVIAIRTRHPSRRISVVSCVASRFGPAASAARRVLVEMPAQASDDGARGVAGVLDGFYFRGNYLAMEASGAPGAKAVNALTSAHIDDSIPSGV